MLIHLVIQYSLQVNSIHVPVRTERKVPLPVDGGVPIVEHILTASEHCVTRQHFIENTIPWVELDTLAC